MAPQKSLKSVTDIVQTNTSRLKPGVAEKEAPSAQIIGFRLFLKKLNPGVPNPCIFVKKHMANIKIFLLHRSGLFSSFSEQSAIVGHEFFDRNVQ